MIRLTRLVAVVCLLVPAAANAQVTPPTDASGSAAAAPSASVNPPADYVIGVEDVLGVRFWRDDTLSGDVVVRPDGMISIPLLNDVRAVGLTPEVLRQTLQKAAKQFLDDPNVTIIVRQINSRKVFAMGQVSRSGSYPLHGPMTVAQLLALAGLTEYADVKKIRILRQEGGKEISLPFNYEDVRKGKKLEQNILLKVGDTVVVP